MADFHPPGTPPPKASNSSLLGSFFGGRFWKGFFDFEIAKLRRFQEYVAAGPNPGERLNIHQVRRDFVNYIDEYDRRRGKDFVKVFPELAEFYQTHKGT